MLVSGTAGTQMPFFIAILIRWIPSSLHCVAAEAPVSIPVYQSRGMKMRGKSRDCRLVMSSAPEAGTTVVLISSFTRDIVRSLSAEWLWPRISQAAIRMSAWRFTCPQVTAVFGRSRTTPFQTQSWWSPRVPHDMAVALHIRIRKTFKGKGFQKGWTAWAPV